MYLLFFSWLFAVIFIVIPALMLKAVINIINNSESDLSESVRTNFTISLLSYALSMVLIAFYKISNSDESIHSGLFFELCIMGYCSFIAFILLYILSYIRKSFQWSEVADLISKMIATIIFYIPVYYILSLVEGLQSFTYWSLAGTLAVILFNYRHLVLNKSFQSPNENNYQE